MNKYIFILGASATDLAKQEIISVLAGQAEKIELIGPNFIIAQTERRAKELLKILGGTVKIALFLDKIENIHQLDNKKWLSFIWPYLSRSRKNNFGFSLYNAPRSTFNGLYKTALSIKNELTLQKYRSRLVTSRYHELSSVIISKNNLLDKELIIIKHNSHWFLGLTKVVQDFESYGYRDIKRPSRDMQAGLLPPKVSQMIVNLAGHKRDGTLFDPFCGSGTILQEAALLGYQKLIGSDSSQKAISDCQANLNWLSKHYSLHFELTLNQSEVQNIANYLLPQTIDLIVTEPFMGDTRFVQRQEHIDKLQDVQEQLTKLYLETFKQFKKVLKDKGEIIFIFPIFSIKGQKLYTLDKKQIEALGFTQKKPDISSSKLSANGNIIYSRADQKVLREISHWILE